MIVTDALARRLEMAEALDAAGCVDACRSVDPECGATVAGIGGGVIAYCGADSPLTHALGVGMDGPVREDDIAEIEEFYRSRSAPVTIDLCPHADPSLLEILVRREYRLSEMNTVLVRALRAEERWPVPVEVAPAEDAGEFAGTLTRGFFSRDEVNEEEIRIGLLLFHMPGIHPLLARVDGQPAGGCGYSLREGVASLFGDATLRAFRGRGVHGALIAARLNAAMEAGCDLATAGTQPGSTSQRNYQRMGFEVAYTKSTMVR